MGLYLIPVINGTFPSNSKSEKVLPSALTDTNIKLGDVILCWDIALLSMKLNELCRIYSSPKYAFGEVKLPFVTFL